MKAVILAAGIGKRLKDKYYLKLNGKTLIEHQYNKLRCFTKDISIVYFDEKVKELHKDLDVIWIKNETGEKINSVKLAVQNSSDTCLVVLADMINVDYEKYFKISQTTFSFNKHQMPPVVINKNDFETILKSEFNSIKEIISGASIDISDYEKRDIDYMQDVIDNRKTVVVVSAGDLASATINRVHKKGYNVIVVEKLKPLAVRRSVSYSEAMYDNEKVLDGVCVKRSSVDEIFTNLVAGHVPIISDVEFNDFDQYDVIVDITLRKQRIKYEGLSIGVGPGFVSGEDVTYVIESMRGASLGKIIRSGSAMKNTSIPTNICGYDTKRVVYSNNAGTFTSEKQLGEDIEQGEVFGYIDHHPVYASISGQVRGQIRPGTEVSNNVKIGDINPLGNNVDINMFSDKALKIAESILAVLEEVL